MHRFPVLDFLPKPKYPTYPSYHVGYYLEEYFINWFFNNQYQNISLRECIPISWTSCYNDNHNLELLQLYLNTYDSNKKYFTVCQHDDAPKFHKLPPNTLIFSAGGNYMGLNKISIPLICSKLPQNYIKLQNKDIFCSFVGSTTHPLRTTFIEKYKNDNEFVFNYSGWNASITENALLNFINISSRSKYTLCPRGYGTTSFRLYEAMQLNTIPVYISDHHDLPWSDEINWNEFCVIIKPEEINNLKEILKIISKEKYEMMLNKIKELYNNYFTLNGVCVNIMKRL